MGNARKMQDLNCSIVAKDSGQLGRAVQKIAAEKELYKSNVETLRQYSRKFEGLENAAAVIENAAKI
jgi:hypothetical protein